MPDEPKPRPVREWISCANCGRKHRRHVSSGRIHCTACHRNPEARASRPKLAPRSRCVAWTADDMAAFAKRAARLAFVERERRITEAQS